MKAPLQPSDSTIVLAAAEMLRDAQTRVDGAPLPVDCSAADGLKAKLSALHLFQLMTVRLEEIGRRLGREERDVAAASRFVGSTARARARGRGRR